MHIERVQFDEFRICSLQSSHSCGSCIGSIHTPAAYQMGHGRGGGGWLRADEHKGGNPALTKARRAPWPHAQLPVSRAGLSLLDVAFSQEVVVPSCV